LAFGGEAKAQQGVDTASPTESGWAGICTDRPTKSNNACTVDPKTWQVESDLLNGSFQRLNGVTTDTWYITNPTFKYGLAKGFDVEVTIAPYEIVRTRDDDGERSLGGVGDLYIRLKYAAFAGRTVQISLIPYIKAPTARDGVGNGALEGGVIAPINVKLTTKWSLTFSPEADVYTDISGEGRHFNTSQTVNIGYSLPAGVTLYGELWGDWSFDPAGTLRQYSLDFAATKLINKSFQVDGGVNFGLNQSTPGVQVYAGVSKKW